MRKLSESVWGDLRKKSLGQVDRQEDAFNPDFIDFGDDTTVYWSKNGLVIDDKSKFHFDEVENYNNNGWRLPTIDEIKQIDWENKTLTWKDNLLHIKLSGGEFILNSSGMNNINMWAQQPHNNFPGSAYAYGYNFNNGDRSFSIKMFNRKHSNLLVLLVKDKRRKLSESVWGDLRKKSLGQEERVENSVDNMNIGEFCDYLKDNYQCIHRPSDIHIDVFDNVPTIVITLYEDEAGTYRYIYYDGKQVDTQDDVPSTIGCSNDIHKFYTINNIPNTYSIAISPQDNSKITNRFFMEVLDFLLDRIDTPLEQQVIKG